LEILGIVKGKKGRKRLKRLENNKKRGGLGFRRGALIICSDSSYKPRRNKNSERRERHESLERGRTRERKGSENEGEPDPSPIYIHYRTGPVHLNQTGSICFKPFV